MANCKRKGSLRRKSRSKMTKNINDRGKISINKYLQSFNPGDKVTLCAEPAVQNGLYHMRFHNRMGVIEKSQGACYLVKVKDFTKSKTFIIHPVHLKRI
jgi:large subunit ribosomal protein L21e